MFLRLSKLLLVIVRAPLPLQTNTGFKGLVDNFKRTSIVCNFDLKVMKRFIYVSDVFIQNYGLRYGCQLRTMAANAKITFYSRFCKEKRGGILSAHFFVGLPKVFFVCKTYKKIVRYFKTVVLLKRNVPLVLVWLKNYSLGTHNYALRSIHVIGCHFRFVGRENIVCALFFSPLWPPKSRDMSRSRSIFTSNNPYFWR